MTTRPWPQVGDAFRALLGCSGPLRASDKEGFSVAKEAKVFHTRLAGTTPIKRTPLRWQVLKSYLCSIIRGSAPFMKTFTTEKARSGLEDVQKRGEKREITTVDRWP